MKPQNLLNGFFLATLAGSTYAVTPPLETLTHAKQVTQGFGYACVLKDDSTVWCWGNNVEGELGDGTFNSRNYAQPVQGIVGATAVSAGGRHTCALLNDGTVECWGANYNHESGTDSGTTSSVPVFVHGAVYTGEDHLSGAVSIATGNQHTCAQLDDGNVVCWGKNNYGQLGNGTTNIPVYPVYAELSHAAIGIAAGNEYTCAILASDTMQCWGRNNSGQLGDGGYEPYSLPVNVKLAKGDVPILGKSNDDNNACVVLSNRSIKCWGRNEAGELGNGSDDGGYDYPHSTPGSVVVSTLPFQPLYPVTDVAVGYHHACAKLDDGVGNTSMQCWGDNLSGQLGDGGQEDSSDFPTAVLAFGNVSTPLTGVVGVSAEGFSTCAVLTGGTTQCWGDNGFGQLGNGFFGNLSAPIFPVKQAIDEIFDDGFN